MKKKSKPVDGQLLWLESNNLPSDKPNLDDITRKVAYAFNNSERGSAYKGHFECDVCGIDSKNSYEYYFYLDHTSLRITLNPLCVHNIAYHRNEVPESDFDIIAGLNPENTLSVKLLAKYLHDPPFKKAPAIVQDSIIGYMAYLKDGTKGYIRAHRTDNDGTIVYVIDKPSEPGLSIVFGQEILYILKKDSKDMNVEEKLEIVLGHYPTDEERKKWLFLNREIYED